MEPIPRSNQTFPQRSRGMGLPNEREANEDEAIASALPIEVNTPPITRSDPPIDSKIAA